MTLLHPPDRDDFLFIVPRGLRRIGSSSLSVSCYIAGLITRMAASVLL